MKRTFGNFYKTCCIAIILGIVGTANAAVTQRPTAANKAASNRVGGRTDARMPTVTTTPTTVTTTAELEPIAEPEPEPVIETPEPVIIVDNKTSMFNEVLSETGASTDTSNTERAELVRRQRALLDAAGNRDSTQTGVNKLTANKCDADLRKCMMEKCGNDFTKCAKDSSTIWNEKMESCRRNTKCTGHEYALLAPEILADRDMNVRMSYYNSVIDCGDRYNSCIFGECGTMLTKCLAKSDGDRAISKCDKIARECREQDSGLAQRVMSVFGDLRTIATKEAQRDEARLAEIRNLMRDQCIRFGAMFDERSLDCIYTVNFLAGEDASTPMASKKLYAGDTFQCNAGWFGIDATTFKENAYRLTRSQKSASAAMLGAGLGTAVGLISSGAIDRAISTQKAEKERNEAACEKAGYEWKNGHCVDDDGNRIKIDKDGNVIEPESEDGSQSGSPQRSGKSSSAISCAQLSNEKCQNTTVCELNNKNECVDKPCEKLSRSAEDCNSAGSRCKMVNEQCIAVLDLSNQNSENSIQEAECKVYTGNKLGCESKADKCKYTSDKECVARTNTGENTPACDTYNAENCPKDRCVLDDDTCVDSEQPANPNSPANDKGTTTNSSNNQQKYSMTLNIAGPTKYTGKLYGLSIECNGQSETHNVSQTENKISITVYDAQTQCTINANGCDPYRTTAQNLYEQRNNKVQLTCKGISNCIGNSGTWENNTCIHNEVTLTYSEVQNKLKATQTGDSITLKSVTCGNATLDKNTKYINVGRNVRCTISFSTPKGNYTLTDKYTASDIKSNDILKIKI